MHLSGVMKDNKVLALSLVSLFLFAGCLGIVDSQTEVEVPSIELPEDWSETVQRTVSNP